MGDPKLCGYKFIYGENNSDETNKIQYLIMYEIVLCIRVDSYLSHMLYEW